MDQETRFSITNSGEMLVRLLSWTCASTAPDRDQRRLRVPTLAAFISDLCSACTTLVQVGISRIMTATLVSPTTESRYEKTRPCACLAPRTSTGTRYCTMQCPASTALQGLLYAPSIYRSTSGKSYSISCALFHFLSPIVLHRPDSPQTL